MKEIKPHTVTKTIPAPSPISAPSIEDFELEMIVAASYFSLYNPANKRSLAVNPTEFREWQAKAISDKNLDIPSDVLVYAVRDVPRMSSMVAVLHRRGSKPVRFKRPARAWIMGEEWEDFPIKKTIVDKRI